MLKQFALAVALCGAYASIRPALADPVNATAPVALFNVELLDGTDLSNASGLMLDFGTTTARGAGDFLPIPAQTSVAVEGPLYLYTALGGPGDAPFAFSIGSFGRFVTSAAPLILNSSKTATSTGIEAYLLGIFSPAGDLGSFTPGPASFDVSFTRSIANNAANGSTVASTSGSGTLASPPSPIAVVEPGSMLLLATGAGMVGLTVGGRRKPQPAGA